MLDSSSDNRRD